MAAAATTNSTSSSLTFSPTPGPYFQLPEEPRGEDSPAWTRARPGSPKFLRSPPTLGRLASPRPGTPKCHRGSQPRRRPGLRRLGTAPLRAALGERDQPRGLSSPGASATPPALGPRPRARAAMLHGVPPTPRVGPSGGRPPGSAVGVSVVGTGLLVTISVTLGATLLLGVCAAATQSAARQVAAQSSRRETPDIVSSAQASAREKRELRRRTRLRPALRPPAAPPPRSPPRRERAAVT